MQVYDGLAIEMVSTGLEFEARKNPLLAMAGTNTGPEASLDVELAGHVDVTIDEDDSRHSSRLSWSTATPSRRSTISSFNVREEAGTAAESEGTAAGSIATRRSSMPMSRADPL